MVWSFNAECGKGWEFYVRALRTDSQGVAGTMLKSTCDTHAQLSSSFWFGLHTILAIGAKKFKLIKITTLPTMQQATNTMTFCRAFSPFLLPKVRKVSTAATTGTATTIINSPKPSNLLPSRTTAN